SAAAIVAVGHWALFLGYGMYFTIFGGGSKECIQELAAVHGALTPPCPLFLFGFRSLNPTNAFGDDPDQFALRMGGRSLLGLVVFAVATVLLWRANMARFRRIADPTSDTTSATEAPVDTARKPRPSRLKRRLRWAGGTLLLLAVALAVAWYISSLKGDQR